MGLIGGIALSAALSFLLPTIQSPISLGGSVWIRGVGGELTNKFSSNATGASRAARTKPRGYP